MKLNKRSVVLLAALLLAVAGTVFYFSLDSERQTRQQEILAAGIIMLPQAHDLPLLTFTRHDAQPLTTTELRGKWNLVFFGYTFCPDICPTTLAELKQLQGLLPTDVLSQLRILMVTVDPDRDTPAQLRKYLSYFTPDFIGLTGSLEDTLSLSAALGIPFIPADIHKKNYTVDHSGNLAIIGPDARLHGFVQAPLKISRLASQLPEIMQLP